MLSRLFIKNLFLVMKSNCCCCRLVASPFHSVRVHVVERAEPPKPATLEILLGDSEAIRFLGSVRRV
jgi:hypothetical protein